MDTAPVPALVPRPALPAYQAARRRLAAATAWFGGSLHRRFVAMSLGLLLVIQLASFMVIDASMNDHAMSAIPEQLAMGTRTLQRMLDWRAQRLEEGARLLAADYGFRAAVQSNDRETIASVLANHGARIGATEVALLDMNFAPIALAEGTTWDDRAGAATAARLAARAGAPGGPNGASSLAMMRDQPRQAVLVPLKAPVLVGWVLMYFPIRESVKDDVHDLAAADLTVVSRPDARHAWQVAFTRLPAPQAAELARYPWSSEGSASTEPMTEVPVGGRRFGVHALWLTPHESPGNDQPDILALVSVSVNDALRPPRDLQLALMVTTLLGFAAFAVASLYSSRRITTPLQSLASAAERLGAGDAVSPIHISSGHDEVRELAQALERMRVSLIAKQEQIVQAEKLASIGQLAAGVAHEINNPMGFIFSNFGTLEDYLASLFRMLAAYEAEEAALAGTPSAERLARLRGEIELDYLREDIPALMSESREGIRRVRKIVQDLKDFSHADTHDEWETVDLHAGIESTLTIVNNEVKYKADVVREFGTLPRVECLSSQLNQVFMNLIVNAAQAMGPQRGTITLRSGVSNETPHGGVSTATPHNGMSGESVWIEVADNGSGIARDDLKRIFDPFFTTKPVGKGTGLGLSLSYGIVKKHRGRIDVTSTVGQGTAFRVWIPVRRGDAVA